MAIPVLTGYLLFISLLTFILFGADKRKARHNKWRVPESRLLAVSFLGGSIGGLLGMYIFHHKTQHLKFSIGLPCILMLQLLTGVYVFSYFY